MMKSVNYAIWVMIGFLYLVLTANVAVSGTIDYNQSYDYFVNYEHSVLKINESDYMGFAGDSCKYMYNNPEAVDVSYDELINFVENDKTDNLLYVNNLFKCLDFATVLHNNAEEKGIRTGIVLIKWENKSIGHAINCFNTTDKGMIYIDSVGSSEYQKDVQYDSISCFSGGNYIETNLKTNKECINRMGKYQWKKEYW
jgi:hypothetical protein